MSAINNNNNLDFAGSPLVKTPPANAGNKGLIPGSGRFHMPWGNYTCVMQLLNLCSRAPALQQKPLQ